MVGYDPSGSTVFFGEKADKEIKVLTDKLKDMDELDEETEIFSKEEKRRLKLKRRIRNLISEMHWKTSSFLTEHYDKIMLPVFKTSQMLNSKNLSSTTKRAMKTFSFLKFEQRLTFKIAMNKKDLIMVDESYTSKSCGSCGLISKVGAKEVFTCSDEKCGLVGDRDALAARNIMLKNVTLREPLSVPGN
jgi:putative transposase